MGNWCAAAGNNDPTDPTCTGNTQSYCSELLAPESSVLPTSGFAGETFGTGPYSDAKGKMGLTTTPSVTWSLPTQSEMRQAYLDGIFNVMPGASAGQMGSTTAHGYWTSTVYAPDRSQAYYFLSNAYQKASLRSGTNYVTCVGR